MTSLQAYQYFSTIKHARSINRVEFNFLKTKTNTPQNKRKHRDTAYYHITQIILIRHDFFFPTVLYFPYSNKEGKKKHKRHSRCLLCTSTATYSNRLLVFLGVGRDVWFSWKIFLVYLCREKKTSIYESTLRKWHQ